jgi:hypothetical protein
MGNELAKRTQGAPPQVAGLGGGMVAAIVPQTFDEVYRFAQVVAQSGLAPNGMESAEKLTVSILTGLEVGAKPMQSIQGIAVIGNRPCIWGDLALALVRGAGTLEYIKETFEGDEDACDWTSKNPTGAMLKYKAVCRIKRKGEPEAVTEFSVGDAVVARLWSKSGPWQTNPKRMIKMRARGFGVRDTHADVLKGMYLAEELIGTEVDREPAGGPTPPAPPPAPPARQIGEVKGIDPQPEQHVETHVSDRPIEDAEIIEPASTAPQEGQDAGLTDAAEADADQDEPFDPAAWLDEVRDRFEQALDTKTVDDVHAVYGDTAETDLSLTDRQIYQDMHEAAIMRTAAAEKPAPAAVEPDCSEEQEDEDSVDMGFPGDDAIAALQEQAQEQPKSPGEIYVAKVRAVLDDPDVTLADIDAAWNKSSEERKKLDADGHLSKEARAGLRDDVVALTKRLKEQNAAGPGAPPPPADAGPSAPPPPAGQQMSDIEAYDAAFRAKVEACQDGIKIRTLSAETLGERNAFKGHPQFDRLSKEWTALINDKRKQFPSVP